MVSTSVAGLDGKADLEPELIAKRTARSAACRY